jgi:peptide deformylase
MTVKDIVRDESFLSQKSVPATRDDMSVGNDLKDTLAAHNHECVGMAANMIGVARRIIIARLSDRMLVMYNPVLLKVKDPYETEEGCLSLEGKRKTRRYRSIEVEYYNSLWQKKKKRFSGFEAQIVLHEMDHLEGIVI